MPWAWSSSGDLTIHESSQKTGGRTRGNRTDTHNEEDSIMTPNPILLVPFQ